MIKKITLKNGLGIVFLPMPAMKSASLGIWIRAGSRYEDNKNSGISHFIEHLLFKGTFKRDGLEIKETLEGIGGSLNGFTSEEFTCYLVKMLGEHIDIAIDVLSDMVLNPKFDPADVEKERSVIMEEIKMYLDQPTHYVHELLGELMWPGNSLGMPIAGTFETVKLITSDAIVRYKQKLYSPRNIVIALSGKIDPGKSLKLIEKYFKVKSSGNEINKFKKVKEIERGPRFNINFKETEQTHMAIGFHAISRFNPARHAATILNIILGANMSSRLFQEVREKRALAYEISSHNKNYDDTGAFVISAGVDAKKAPEALRVILKELSKIKKEYVAKDEFKRAKKFYKGQLLMALEDTATSMLWIGEKVMAKERIIDIKKILEIIEKMTVEDVKKAANAIFTKECFNMAVIGPVKEEVFKDSLVLE